MRRARVVAADADVVVQHVETSEGLDAVGYETLAIGFEGGIGLARDRLAAFRPDLLDGLLGRFEPPVHRHHPSALPREEQGGGAPIADGVAGGLTGTHDEGDLALEPAAHRSGRPAVPASSCTPSVFNAIDTMWYWPTVKIRSSSCWVSKCLASAAHVASETKES